MKKILFTSALFFVSLITNAQTLEGEWKFEKMKLFGTLIYFDDTDKDKENLIKSWIKMNESQMDEDEKDEIAEMIKQVNSNKGLIYANAKDQFKYNIEFKEGKLIFKYLNDDDKMEKVEADINLEDGILKLYGTRKLHDTYSFRLLLQTNKLMLTEIDKLVESAGKLTVFYYEKKSGSNASAINDKQAKVEASEYPPLTEEEIRSFADELSNPSVTPKEKAIVFEENFSNNQNKWFEEETDQYSFKIIKDKKYANNDKYRIESKKGGFWLSSIPIDFSTSDDFNITAVFSKESGTDDYYFGMLLGKNRNTGYYHFAGITGSGNCVFANKGPLPKDLILRTENENVEKGNRMNRIEINKKGNIFELLINGYLVAQTSYEKFYGNDFGFQLWSGDQNLTIDVFRLTIKVTKAEK